MSPGLGLWSSMVVVVGIAVQSFRVPGLCASGFIGLRGLLFQDLGEDQHFIPLVCIEAKLKAKSLMRNTHVLKLCPHNEVTDSAKL